MRGDIDEVLFEGTTAPPLLSYGGCAQILEKLCDSGLGSAPGLNPGPDDLILRLIRGCASSETFDLRLIRGGPGMNSMNK